MEIKEVFKANDIRGVYGRILDDNLTYKVGKAISRYLKCKEIFIGRDMRLSSPSLFKALANGLCDSGVDVIDLGLIDTPQIYFATGFYKKHGIMITASHNPAEYNGIKIVKSGARPVDSHKGFDKILQIIEKEDFIYGKRKGRVIRKNIFDKYKKYVLSFVDSEEIENLKVVVDAGNGMASLIVPKVYRKLKIKFIPLYFKLDGRFPNHVPNPILKENIKDMQDRVLKEKADFGIAFDGDMDRVAFVDEKGKFVNTSILGALLAKFLLECCKIRDNEGIIYSSAASRIMKDSALKYGGKPIREKVGHAFIKERMKKDNALFGMEHSAHYYYRDNYYADSGLITSLLILKIYSEAKKQGMKFSELLKEFEVYSQANEVSIVLEHDNVLQRIEKYYKVKNPRKIEHFDGLWVEFYDYWFSVRKSNTEPLLRVNLEAIDEGTMKEKLKGILRLIKR